MQKMMPMILVLMVVSVAAHTGGNHTDEELESEAHDRGNEFQFVEGDYPMETRYIVIVEIVLVSLLLIAALNHYRKRKPEEESS